MPLLFERHDQNYSIAAWRVEESLEELSRMAGILLESLPAKASSRQKEALATRLLLNHLFPGNQKPALVYDDHGKPHLPGLNQSVSISHTGEVVGMLVSSRPSCGLDLERLHPRIEKIAGRFLSEEESHVREQGQQGALYVAWSAKEVLFKIYGKGNLVFREHLRVEPFHLSDTGIVTASIRKNNLSKFYPVEYFFLDDLVVTFALE